MWFNQYPYKNLEDFNLDYVLSQLRTIKETLTNFINLNTIKYANPIQWNITKQYEANTVVIDANNGTAYISVAPVPAGVAITNTDYWTPIFTLDLLSANQNITLRDDGANVLATFASDVDDWVIWNNTLYKVTRAIAVNESYVVGYNLDRYTVELFIKDYINSLVSIIGDLDNLTTADKSNIVAAINETLSSLDVLGTVISEDIAYDSAHTFDDFTKSFNDSVITTSHDVNNNSKMSDIRINSSNNPAVWNNGEIFQSDIDTTNNIGIDYSNETNHYNMKIISNNVKGNHFGVLVDNAANGDGLIISNNAIISDNGDSVEINTPYNDSTKDFRNVIISSNLLDIEDMTPTTTANGVGVGIARNKGTVVVGNLSKKSRVSGLHIEDNSSDIVVSNNIFKNCKRYGSYIDFGYSTNESLENKGNVGIVSNNVFHHRPDDVTDIGLYKVYSGAIDDSFGNYRNNIIEGFDVGISMRGGSTTGHDFDIDGCIVKDCNVGIDLSIDTHGTLTLINCTKGVKISGNMCHIDKLIAYGIAGEDVLDINASHYNFTVDEIILNMKGTFEAGVTKNIIPIPMHFKGTITLSQNNFNRIYDVDDSTLTLRHSNLYGSVVPTLSTDNGYYTIALSVSGAYNVKISIKGDYLMFA